VATNGENLVAQIWRGDGKLAAEKPLEFCYASLGLRLRHRLDHQPLVIGTKEDPQTAPSLGLRFAVVEVTEDDPDQQGWQIGYYLLDKDATEVRKLLGID
jgi:hypothetical protein